MRRQARELAFSTIFEYLFTQEFRPIDDDLFAHSGLDEQDVVFAHSLYVGTIDNLETYKQLIAGYSKGFRLERVYRVDFAALCLCMYELTTSTPVAVCVNETVDLVRKFSTEKSAKYVNGILAEHVRQLYPSV